MDRNLENWLRGKPDQPEDAGNPSSRKMQRDVAALLGLPVAVYGAGPSGKDESSPDAAPTERPYSETESAAPPEAGSVPSSREEAEDGVRSLEPDEAERAEGVYGENGQDESRSQGEDLPFLPEESVLPGKEEFSAPLVSPLERESPGTTGRKKRRAAVGMAATAAAVVVGAYFLFGGESTRDLILKGREHSKGGDYVQALAYYKRAAKKNPLEFDALLGIAEALERLDRKGEAVDAYYRCLQVAPEDPLVHARLGFLFFAMSSYDNAIRSFQESVNFDPSDARVFAGMGRAYEAKGDFVQAVSAFKKALDLESSSEEYRSDLERAERALSVQNEEAEKLEREIAARERVLLGRAALGLGDLEESRNRFLQALDLVPDDHDALMGLGDAKKAAGDMEGAASYYRMVLKFHPASAIAAEALAEAEKALSAAVPDGKPNEGNVKGGSTETKHNVPAAHAAGKEPPRAKKEPKSGTTAPKTSHPSAVQQKKPAPTLRPSRKGQPQAERVRPEGRGSGAGTGRVAADYPPLTPRSYGKEFTGREKSLWAPASVSPAAGESPGALWGKGMEQLRRGNYSSAFSLFWKRMLLPSSLVSGASAESSRIFGGVPFSERRWRDITPVEEGPLAGNIPNSIPLPGTGGMSPGWAAAKAPLMEAVALNPEEGGVYLNLAMSYILRRKEEGRAVVFRDRDEEEQAVYFSLLAHAWLRNGERDKAALFLNAAKRRARGELLSHVLSLERFFLGKEKLGT